MEGVHEIVVPQGNKCDSRDMQGKYGVMGRQPLFLSMIVAC